MKYLKNYSVYILLILATAGSALTGFAQDKSILERKSSAEYSFELLNPMNLTYDYFVFATRHSLAYRYKTKTNTEIGAKFLTSKYNSYYYSYDVYTRDRFGNDTVFDGNIKRGNTKSTGFELSIRKYRQKTGGIAPFGMFFEFIGGMNSYTFSEKTAWSDYTVPAPTIDTIPDRKLITYSMGIKFGRQWLLESNVILNMGICYKFHLPKGGLSEEVSRPKYELFEMYANDILQRDLLSTFASIGYVF